MRRRLNSRAYDPYDEWLETLGLYRKQVARDGSCLFRAVAEQVFMTQTEHERLRSLCLEYMMIHKDDFQPFLDIPLDHHVFNLQDVREWGGHLEIMAMSRLFHVNFLIYREIGQEPYKATNIEGRTLMLSFTHGNHYDIIYKRDDASSRGFCQSVIYDILYSHVFKLKDVRLAVDTMLHDKEYASLRRDSANSAELKEIGALVEKILGTNISRDSQDEGDKNASIEEKISLDDIHPDDVRGLLAHGIPPFPYKVAKSLDPDIYRNIEYDTWNTVRREARYGPFDSNGFQAGVKVLIKLDHLPNRQEVEDMRKAHINRSGNGEASESKPSDAKLDVYHGHIQEMSENKGPVDVYIEEIGSRLKVPYESLEKVPPSPPRSPWHGHPQQQLQASGGVSAPGGGLPSYKKLSGYYQKAPLPVENEFPVGKSKKKGGKQMREAPPHSSSIRGSLGSPTAVAHSPRSRTPQGIHPQTNYNRNSHGRGMGRGSNNSFRNSGSPAREDFPSFPTSASVPASVEGVWAVRPNANQSMVSSTPKSNCGSYYPTTPQPPMGEDETRLQIQAVTEALQQVMSAGGQEVRVTGQQLEVINSIEGIEDQSPHQLEGTTSVECSVISNKVDGKVNAVSLGSEAYPVCQPDQNPSKLTGLEPVVSQPQCVNFSEDGTPQPLLYQPDPTMAFMSPPPATQMGGVSPSPQNAAMYTVTFPPYASPTYVQMLTPVPADGSLTPSEFTPPPSAQGRPESVDGSIHGPDSEIMKNSQGLTSVMIYQVPVMYGGGGGGYGYGYNQPWTYMPVMSSPNAEDGKLPPVPGNELYQPMVPVSGWGGPSYMGEMMQPPPYAVPPQSVPAYPHEPPVPQYPPPPPPPAFHERPPYHHHHHRGRGRGGAHHYNHQNRGHHNETSPYNPHMEGMGRGGGQRPLPPRFHRGGGAPLGRGGPRYPHHISNTPPPNYQRSHQYEGQPLMQMGSRKSSTESLASQQVASGGSVGSGGLASPPLVTYVEPERPPGVIPLSTQDGPPLPPQESMAYYPTPPGYMMSGPWMWKMM